MGRYITKEPNYNISAGDYAFATLQSMGARNTLCVVLAGLNTNDASVEVEQSVDDSNWGLYPGSKQMLAAGQTNHQWNISGLPGGIFLRVYLRKGTATAGVIQAIKLLSDE